MGDVKILVTATGAPGAASLMRGLRENGEQPVTLVGTDMRPQSAGRFLCDHFHEVPAGNDPRFVEALAEVAREEQGGLRVPAVVGRDPRDLARRRPFDVPVLVCKPDSIVRAASKTETARLAAELGSPTRAASRPETRTPSRPLPASSAIPGRRVHEAGRGQGRTRIPSAVGHLRSAPEPAGGSPRHAASAVRGGGGRHPRLGRAVPGHAGDGADHGSGAGHRCDLPGRTHAGDQRQDARGDPGGTGDGVRDDRPARPAGVVHAR